MSDHINDFRDTTDFKKLTISNYKKTDVIKEFIKSLKETKHESACYWSAELISSGNFIELWETIILYMSKYIHIGNPKLPIYIDSCIDIFKSIITNEQVNDELNLRNNTSIRKLFAEISITLVDSSRKHSFADPMKISPQDFDVSTIGSKLKAPHINYIKNLFREGDTKEVYIALNEFYYNITDAKDSIMACYWVEWILEFDVLMRKHKKKNLCERRQYVPVAPDEQINMIWMIWDVFFDLAKSPIQKKIMHALLNIFCLKFSKGIPKKRKYILYFAVALFTENINYNVPLIKNSDYITKVKDNIHLIYREIKKNEIPPKTDYLLASVKTSKEKSVEKMKILEKVKF
jgi:hypothetical protein